MWRYVQSAIAATCFGSTEDERDDEISPSHQGAKPKEIDQDPRFAGFEIFEAGS
jgi:hypothetical protein